MRTSTDLVKFVLGELSGSDGDDSAADEHEASRGARAVPEQPSEWTNAKVEL